MEKYILNSPKETQELGQHFADQILARKPGKQAVVLALTGDLGAGKTTFLQGFAKGLEIEEVVNSPTFILMKKFQIPSYKSQINSKFKIQNSKFSYFYHFDLYRLENQTDVEFLHLAEIISDPKNIIAIEWPEKINNVLPKNVISITFGHLDENKRELTIDK